MTFNVTRTVIITVIFLIVYLLGYQYGIKNKNIEIRKASVYFIVCLLIIFILNLIFKGLLNTLPKIYITSITLLIVTFVSWIYLFKLAVKETKIENKIKDDYYKKKSNREKERKIQKQEIIELIKSDKLHNKYNSIIFAVLIYALLYLLVFLLIF